jgi:hypothetical protein
MSYAESIMRRYNRNGLIGEEDSYAVMIEDHSDPDGRMYRLEYRSTSDGRKAIAYCIFNPWGGGGDPNAGEDYPTGHVAEDGFICLGGEAVHDLESSPYDLDYTIRRARYWCTAFSVLKENGEFPNL